MNILLCILQRYFALLTLISPGYFGGWVARGGGGGGGGSPFRSWPWKICIKVECDVNYKTVLLDWYANLCNKSYFHYKSLIKASRLLIFGTYILFNFLSDCALKNFSIEINFLCILLFYEFLMYFFVFSTYLKKKKFCCNLLQPLSQALSS